MTDALITELGRIRALRVISRTSVMTYKSARKPARRGDRRIPEGDRTFRPQRRLRLQSRLCLRGLRAPGRSAPVPGGAGIQESTKSLLRREYRARLCRSWAADAGDDPARQSVRGAFQSVDPPTTCLRSSARSRSVPRSSPPHRPRGMRGDGGDGNGIRLSCSFPRAGGNRAARKHEAAEGPIQPRRRPTSSSCRASGFQRGRTIPLISSTNSFLSAPDRVVTPPRRT
jgi:hypothetical protein